MLSETSCESVPPARCGLAPGLTHLWTCSAYNLFSVYSCLFNVGAETSTKIEQ